MLPSLVSARAPHAFILRIGNGTLLDTLKNIFIAYFLVKRTLKIYRHLCARGLSQTLYDFWRWVSQETLLLALHLPAARKRVNAELMKGRLQIEKGLIPEGPSVRRHLTLPEHGQMPQWITEEMDRMDSEANTQADWREGKVSGAVYHGGDDLTRVILAAIARYALSNPLHPDVFPAVRKMEAEIVSMCLNMYNNPNGAGTTTSGGTESIIMAVKTYRDWARAVKGVTEPEMIVPVTAHAAFDKGAAYMNIKVHTIPVDPGTRKVDLKHVARAINSNTIMLVGSAINFPDGNMDDIPALGALAQRHKIGLHVDCCLGSFIMPFLEEASFGPIPLFDFRVPGVTSISCDTHKYGFAPKGNSVIMYRDAELRRYQYYVNPDWVGGVYASPSIAGSRPGALIAGTWAAMNYMGRDGYLTSCKSIVGAARTIAHRIRTEIPELRVLGDPPASVVAFASADEKALNVHEVGDKMAKKGWHLNALTGPPALHIAVTRLTVPIVDQFIADLKDAVRDAKLEPSGKGTMVVLYGLGTSSPVGPTMVGHLATAFLDTLYKA
ncbi:PLP-dependent transferase [Laetiporus sulphureus 93-53]|uniref:sphinganine-1-phosphate aldolase n=1 Tax=Laetiporus sulphureus 93-53 TaxID=1314785 RepID=A0A165GUX3_9APHY|nr:PLP-dependent transferase [Laetiporus sulphureus 93-53]KZT10847.1 PLP-dependent transferase [Laetiporus sulphureus 93-53]